MINQSKKSLRKNKPGQDGNGAGLLSATGDAAALLLSADDWLNIEYVLTSALELIGCTLNADRVYIWRDMQMGDCPDFRRIYGWAGDNDSYDEPPPEITITIKEYSEWQNKLDCGEMAGGILSGMSKNEQTFFGKYSIKTLYFVPIFLGNAYWGVISVGYCNRECCLSNAEQVFLKTVSHMAASAIHRHNMAAELTSTAEKANEATRVKNAFLSNMSHEVRTPLNAIVGMAAVGSQSSNILEKNHALNKIGDASAHLLEIISNVLDMARIEEDKLELVPTEFNIREMVDKAVASVKHLSKEKNQFITVNVDEAICPNVIGDELRMNQLISNLLTNAIKFTPIYGRVWLDFLLRSETNEFMELQIIVKDNGIGIAEDQQDKLFMPFVQTQGALNRDFGGTGLGLPISKRIVELMDGSITVVSEPNRGTTVDVKIPVAKGRADVNAADNEEDYDNDDDIYSGNLIVPGEFKGKRLLVVEDIEINREILIALLKKSEIAIDCAEDGQIAVDMVMFNIEKYDIVFMDLQMPNLGGLEATRLIRELPERKRGRLPIVAMTANVFSDDVKACMDAGMDAHLSKPLDIEKVLEVLRKYLSD